MHYQIIWGTSLGELLVGAVCVKHAPDIQLGQVRRASAALESLSPAQLTSDDRLSAVYGDALLANGNGKQALEMYRAAQKLRRGEPAYLIREARALRSLGKPTDASQVLEAYVEKGSVSLRAEYVASLLDSARDAAAAGDARRAARILASASAVDANDDRVHLASAAVLAAINEANDAKRELDAVREQGAYVKAA